MQAAGIRRISVVCFHIDRRGYTGSVLLRFFLPWILWPFAKCAGRLRDSGSRLLHGHFDAAHDRVLRPRLTNRTDKKYPAECCFFGRGKTTGSSDPTTNAATTLTSALRPASRAIHPASPPSLVILFTCCSRVFPPGRNPEISNRNKKIFAASAVLHRAHPHRLQPLPLVSGESQTITTAFRQPVQASTLF
jgi:hypothetical protein